MNTVYQQKTCSEHAPHHAQVLEDAKFSSLPQCWNVILQTRKILRGLNGSK